MKDQAHKQRSAWRDTLARNAGAHAQLRRRFGLEPEADFAERVLAAYRPPNWAVGSIGVLDAMALRDMVHGVRPAQVVELGTAAGTSALVLAAAMREIGRSRRCVHTYDLHPWCFFDRSRAVGAAIDDAEPALARMITRRVGQTAANAGLVLGGIELAFIDADHRHPMPAADLLALLPALAPGAWVVLHDVDLPNAAEQYEKAHGVTVDWKQHGAKWLFEAWPHERLRPHANLGALRIPDSGTCVADIRAALEGCLARPWETTPSGAAAEALAA